MRAAKRAEACLQLYSDVDKSWVCAKGLVSIITDHSLLFRVRFLGRPSSAFLIKNNRINVRVYV